MTDKEKEIHDLRQALLKAQEDIEKLARIKSDFVSIVSHELRTPLTSIKESVSLVLDGVTGSLNEDQKHFLSIAKNNLERFTGTITDILDFSKLESGRLIMHKRKMDINSVIRDIHSLFKNSVEKKKLSFELELYKDGNLIWFDPGRISQVLSNLISNAIKFNKEKGGIRIFSNKGSVDGREVIKVCVQDSGIGISKEDLPNLFKRFSPLDTSMTRNYRGVGLGLVICKGIVELHGGDIWVESEKDKGSRFIFTLPVYKKDNEFNFLLDEAVERARYNDTKLSLIVFKIKDKKDISEDVLSELEKKIRFSVRGPEDKVVRFKEGDLIAIMAGTDKDGAERIMQRIKKNVKISLNFGLAVYPDRAKAKDDLVKEVEKELKSKKFTL